MHCVAALLRIATHRAGGAVMAGALQLTDNYKVATPANWQDGDEVVIVPSLKDEDEIKQRFPKGYRAVKPYLRLTPQPNR